LGPATVARPYSKIIYPSGVETGADAQRVTRAPPPLPSRIVQNVGDGDLSEHATTLEVLLTSSMVQASAPTLTRLTRAQRDQWARENLPSRVQVALDTRFGKESLSHSFSSAIAFRHVLLLVFKSDYLSVKAKRTLLRVSPFARKLNWLCRKYDNLDFTSLQNGIPGNLSTPDLIPHLKGLVTACFLHVNFDTLTVVRYIGGQHTVAHRDVPAILAELGRANVDPDVLTDLQQIFTLGAPSFLTPMLRSAISALSSPTGTTRRSPRIFQRHRRR
jgi:hypothetical protein